MSKASSFTRQELNSIAESLYEGETQTILCPECDGGSAKVKTLSITKKESGQIAFICFRDSCQIKGYIRATSLAVPKKEAKVPKLKELKVAKLLVEQHEEIPQKIEDLVTERYNVSLKKHSCRWEPTTNRVLIPIFDHYIELQGYVARSYSGAEPKALTYKKEDYNGAGWFQLGFTTTQILVVVEDPLSAAAVADLGIDAVALLGTKLADAVIQQIKECNYDRVYVALDYDALAKGIENTAKIKNANVLSLERDIKDMSIEERKALLSNLT